MKTSLFLATRILIEIKNKTKLLIIMNKLLVLILISSLSIISCEKSQNIKNNPVGLGKGTFIFQNEKYDGGYVSKIPSSLGLANMFDVAINCPPGNAVAIYNIPNNSSGNFPINDASVVGTNKTWLAVVFQPGTTFYNLSLGPIASSSGTITKTSSNSFTFTCQVYYSSRPNQKYTVTGQGTY